MTVMGDNGDFYYFIIATKESTACIDFEVTTSEGLDEFYRDCLEHDPDPDNGSMWDGIKLIGVFADCETSAQHYGESQAWRDGIDPKGTITCALRPVFNPNRSLTNN